MSPRKQHSARPHKATTARHPAKRASLIAKAPEKPKKRSVRPTSALDDRFHRTAAANRRTRARDTLADCDAWWRA